MIVVKNIVKESPNPLDFNGLGDSCLEGVVLRKKASLPTKREEMLFCILLPFVFSVFPLLFRLQQ